jgi:hypothetical protein
VTETATGTRRPFASLLVALGVVGVGLAVFDLASSSSDVARRGLLAERPPIYGRFEPGFSRLGVFALALVAVGVAGAFLAARARRVRPALYLAGAVGFLLAFSAAVAVVNGDTGAYTETFERKRPADYQADVHVVRELGVRGFVEDHPRLVPTFTAVHSKTHPPGPVVFYSVLDRVFPDHLVPRAIVIALLASLVLVPIWFLALAFGGERAGTVAVALFAVAPAPVVFAFTSMDAVYATTIAVGAALLVWGIKDATRPWAAIGGGAALAFSSFLTYAGAFVVGFGALYAFFARPRREAVKVLALAAAGGIAALALMRVALGYDVVASYKASFHAVPDETDRSYLYWLVGNPAVWLTFAGLPVAALSMWEFFARRPRYLIALFLPLLAADVTKIFPAETERIGQFAYPFIAAAAGVAFVRWEASSGRRRPGVLAALVGVAALQAILIEALYYTFW